MSEKAAYEPERPAAAGPRVDADAIRRARLEDVESIARISLAREGKGDPVDVRRRIRNEVAATLEGQAAWVVYVAEVDGQVVGYGRARLLDPEPEGDAPIGPPGWYLVGVVVDPAFRRRGIAHALTRARIAWVHERADTLYYFVHGVNRASIDLHTALGFELVGPIAYRRAELDAEDGRLYRLDLGGPRA